MPDITASSTNQDPNIPPPSGDPTQAEKYINQLIGLIEIDKLDVSHTDLGKFDPSALQDHYRLDLKDYEVEVSHSKQPDSGRDFYIILFNNLKYINERCSEKVILAYMHLNEGQFKSFKSSVNKQIERKGKAEEEKRLKEVMLPIDHVLENLTDTDSTSTKDDIVTPSENTQSDYSQEPTSDSAVPLTT